MKNLKNVELFLLDMDGTIYLEDELIPGAKEFIETLLKKKKKYVFLTNNSSVNKEDYLKKLNRLGIPCGEENIFSSSMAAGIFLSTQRKGAKVYLVGTKALAEELHNYGVVLVEDKADIVLAGFDRELTYQKAEKACYFLDQGAEFLATNADFLYPLKQGRYIPDCAAICSMLTLATGKKPYFIGKPNRYMIDILRGKYGLSPNQVALIGDRLYTDIACANNAEIVSVLVLTGEAKLEDLKTTPDQPDFVFASVKELVQEI